MPRGNACGGGAHFQSHIVDDRFLLWGRGLLRQLAIVIALVERDREFPAIEKQSVGRDVRWVPPLLFFLNLTSQFKI